MAELSVWFGSLTARFLGELPQLPEDGLLRRFAADSGTPELTVRITRPTALTPPEGTLCWQTESQRVFRAGERACCFFRTGRPPAGRDVARLFLDDAAPNLLALEVLRGYEAYTEKLLLSSLTMERVLHRHGVTVLHAAWVMREGMALLFCGPSGVGKSTQAELWKQHRAAQIVNGDKVGLTFRDGAAVAIGLPYPGSSPYCLEQSAPVRAIVMLAQAPENTACRLGTREAVRLLAGQMPSQRWCAEDVSAVLDYAVRLTQAVPVYRLSCTKDERAVRLLEQTLSQEN